MSQQLQTLIDNAWEERTNFSPKSAPADVRQAVADVLEQLNDDNGRRKRNAREKERRNISKYCV